MQSTAARTTCEYLGLSELHGISCTPFGAKTPPCVDGQGSFMHLPLSILPVGLPKILAGHSEQQGVLSSSTISAAAAHPQHHNVQQALKKATPPVHTLKDGYAQCRARIGDDDWPMLFDPHAKRTQHTRTVRDVVRLLGGRRVTVVGPSDTSHLMKAISCNLASAGLLDAHSCKCFHQPDSNTPVVHQNSGSHTLIISASSMISACW